MEFKIFEKPRILMVDDDRNFCTKLKEALSEWYQVNAVYEPETAMGKRKTSEELEERDKAQ